MSHTILLHILLLLLFFSPSSPSSCLSPQQEPLLNDGYCDCPLDGSDEPLTSACPNGSFSCSKSSLYIPSGWVGDGICDCPEGDDEGLSSIGECTKHSESATQAEEKEREIEKIIRGARMKVTRTDGLKLLREILREMRNEEASLKKEVAKMQKRGENQQSILQAHQRGLFIADKLKILSKIKKRDFGAQQEYYDLLGKCFSKSFREKIFKGGSFEAEEQIYEFTVCPFWLVLQKKVTTEEDRKKNPPVLLGKWRGWLDDGGEGRFLEDEQRELARVAELEGAFDVAPSSSSSSSSRPLLSFSPLSEGSIMSFSQGEPCWPDQLPRSTLVQFRCGESTELISVLEHGRCRYWAVLQTPAACYPPIGADSLLEEDIVD